MELEKKYFEGLNADDDINLLGETDYINAENFRIGTTDLGSALRLEAIGGTENLHLLSPDPVQAFTPLCAVEDEERSRILYFLYYSSGNHQIRCQVKKTGLNYLVAEQSKADLDFSKNKLIQAKVYGDLLIYTDDNQEIKIINIEAGIKTNNSSYVTDTLPYTYNPVTGRIDYEDITLLRRPPIYAPKTVKELDAAYPLNAIKEQAFQFAWRYWYRDYQYSVLGLWSKLENYNEKDLTPLVSTDDLKRIKVDMSAFEKIPQTVQAVELLAKNMDTGSVQAIRIWDKEIAGDATLISNHNSGLGVLTALFYNDKTGISVSESEQAKPEENIPRKCKTLDTARKRLFIANYLEGFNSPTKTSLTLSLIPANLSTTILAQPLAIYHAAYVNIPLASPDKFSSAYTVYLPSLAVPGWYQLPGVVVSGTHWPTLPAPPTTISFASLVFIGDTEIEAAGYNMPLGYDFVSEYEHPLAFANVDITDVIAGAHTRLFKTGSSVQLGVAFYDRLRRRIGMFTDDSKVVKIPDRAYTASDYKSGIQWGLSNAPAWPLTEEIPQEAYYYGIVMTKNLRTRYFVQTLIAANACRYAMKNPEGVITVDAGVMSSVGKQYVAIDLDDLLKNAMGWQPSPGDLARIYHNDVATFPQPITLAVVGEQGRYLLCEFFDFGSFDAADSMVVEIFVPYKRSDQEDFYEIGEMYKINDPTLSTRNYSALTGTIKGDTHLLARTGYFAEAMSSNDKFWQKWHDDTGRIFPNIKNKEIRKPYSIAFSNVYVIGTQVNGLTAFETLDTEDVSPECGSIQKLLLTSKVQDDGTVMLVICWAETNTLYLGEAQISDSNNTAFFVKSQGVIGSINALRGSYGTQNPESVILHKGQSYWFDALNGCFVRYDVNGLFPISDYKLRRVAKQIGDLYLSMTEADIEALGSRPFIFGGIDPHHNEVLWAIPKLGVPPKGYLNDYPLTYVDAIGYVTITNVGNDGDKIEVFVVDPDYGKVSLGFYVKQSTDTTVTILAASIRDVLMSNPYGYVIASVGGVISITARPGLGEIMNVGNRLSIQLTPFGVSVITWGGINPICLKDSEDDNTGVKRYLNRQRLVDGVPDGYTELNLSGSNFVPNEVDTTLCPIPAAATNYLLINATDYVLSNSVDKILI
jgi:hypothetical protein